MADLILLVVKRHVECRTDEGTCIYSDRDDDSPGLVTVSDPIVSTSERRMRTTHCSDCTHTAMIDESMMISRGPPSVSRGTAGITTVWQVDG